MKKLGLVIALIALVAVPACAVPRTSYVVTTQTAYVTTTHTVNPPPVTATVTVHTPAPTPIAIFTPTILENEWDAEAVVIQRLYNLAITPHAQEVLAALVDTWAHGSFSRDQDGGWNCELHIDCWKVDLTPLLQPILTSSVGTTGGKEICSMEWYATSDGKTIVPANGNALRVEAELKR